MATITYVEPDGTRHEIDVASGYSVMEGAVSKGLPGIDGECGGACACATCHVYVAPDWLERVGIQNEAEAAMLTFARDVQPNSRLSCQIEVTDALDGLIINLPEGQG